MHKWIICLFTSIGSCLTNGVNVSLHKMQKYGHSVSVFTALQHSKICSISILSQTPNSRESSFFCENFVSSASFWCIRWLFVWKATDMNPFFVKTLSLLRLYWCISLTLCIKFGYSHNCNTAKPWVPYMIDSFSIKRNTQQIRILFRCASISCFQAVGK